MPFTPKDWKDAPDGSTPLSAAALEDLETRVTNYTNQEITTLSGSVATRAEVRNFAYPIDTAGMTTSTDIGPAIQAAFDAGYTGVRLYGGGSPKLDTSVFIDYTVSNKIPYRIDMDGTVVVTLTTGLAKVDATAFADDTAVKWGFHVNTLRAGLSAGTVTHNDANIANGTTQVPRLIFGRGCRFDASTAGYGLVFANTAAVVLEDAVSLRTMAWGHGWRGYSDGSSWGNVDAKSMSGGGWLVRGTRGDGLLMQGAQSYGNIDTPAGLVYLNNAQGAKFTNCIQGGFKFVNSRGVSIENYHAEVHSLASVIEIDRSGVSIRDLHAMQLGDTFDPQNFIYIDDDASDTLNASVVNVDSAVFNWYVRSDTGDSARSPDIYINAANTGMRLRVRNSRAVLWREGTSEATPISMLIASADSSIQTAIDNAKHLIASGDWELAFVRGAWQVSPLPPLAGIVTERKMSTPTFSGVAASSATTGELTQSTTYEYIAACMDMDGNYSALSASQSMAATATKAIEGILSAGTTPCVLRVWRKAGAGVASAPDAYADILLDHARCRFIDTGTRINGRLWTTTSVPVPNTVAAADTTWERIRHYGGISKGIVAAAPESTIVAPVGSEAVRSDTGQVYRKLTGTGNTGWLSASGRVSQVVATTTVNTSAAETDLARIAIPANIAKAGDVFELLAWGDLLNNTGGAVTTTWRLYLGATAYLTSGAVSASANANRRQWNARLLIAMESTTAQRFAGNLLISSANGATWDTLGATTTTLVASRVGGAIDMSSARDVALTVQMGTSDANAEVRLFAAALNRLGI